MFSLDVKHHVYLLAPSVSDRRVAKHVSNGLFIIVAAFGDEEIKLNGTGDEHCIE